MVSLEPKLYDLSMWKFARISLTALVLLFISGCVIQVPVSEPRTARDHIETNVESATARLANTCDSLAQEMGLLHV